MMLRSPSTLILEIIRAQINVDPTIEIQSLIYRLKYNKEARIGGHQIKHRDTLNPIFNETFSFNVASSAKITLTLYANHYQIGAAEISLNTNTKMTPLMYNGVQIGVLHFKLGMSKQSDQSKGYLKHNKNVQSEHYKRKNERLITKPDRDKSFDVVRSQNISSKKISSNKDTVVSQNSRDNLFNKTRQQSSQSNELLQVQSAYFKKKQDYKKLKTTVKTESNSSDLKQEQTSKFSRLQNDLKGTQEWQYRAYQQQKINSQIEITDQVQNIANQKKKQIQKKIIFTQNKSKTTMQSQTIFRVYTKDQYSSINQYNDETEDFKIASQTRNITQMKFIQVISISFLSQLQMDQTVGNTNNSSTVISDKQIKLNPFLYTNRIIRDQIKEQRLSHFVIPMALHTIATVALQPLNVVGTLLQLSVKEHKNIYKTPVENSFQTLQGSAPNAKIQTTAVSRINKDITLIQKKKMEMQMLSGGKHKPFTAPVYSSYVEAFKNLWEQGYKSFFKGLVSSSALVFYRSLLRYGILHPYIYREYGQVHPQTNTVIDYLALTLMDIGSNYLHMVESRFILQNSAPQFSTYRNIKQFVLSQWGMKRYMTIGWKTHFLRNIFILGADHTDALSLFVTNYILLYPITTCYKRIVCQSGDAGMIPQRYGSVWHCFRLTLQQQGLKGLYRGFLANSARQFLLFSLFRELYNNQILSENRYWIQGMQKSNLLRP